jgi:preprotein translocase subunit SecD
MKKQTTTIQYLFTTILLIGVIILGYVPRSIASTELVPASSSTALTAQLILKPAVDTEETVLSKAAHVIKERLTQTNLDGTFVVSVVSGHIQVDLSEGKDAPYIKNLITKVGQIEFVDGGNDSPPLNEITESGNYAALFASDDVTQFELPADGDIFYQLTLNPESHPTTFSQEKPNNYICMAMDGKIANCSSMYYWTSNRLQILPNLSGGSGLTMNTLMIFINSGPLPIPLEIVD